MMKSFHINPLTSFKWCILQIDRRVITNVAKAKTTEELEKALGKDILVTWCNQDGPLQNVTVLKEFKEPCDLTTTAMNAISTTIDSLNGTQMCTSFKNVTVEEPEVIKKRCKYS